MTSTSAVALGDGATTMTIGSTAVAVVSGSTVGSSVSSGGTWAGAG